MEARFPAGEKCVALSTSELSEPGSENLRETKEKGYFLTSFVGTRAGDLCKYDSCSEHSQAL
jgi:hypothetical protein